MAGALTVAVLGAGGTIAPAIVRDLAESPEVEQMVLIDLDAQRAEAVAQRHAPGRSQVRAVNQGEALAPALAGCDVLVNSASYRVNLEAMDAYLQAGCHYIDLGGLYWMTDRQLERNAEFESAGLLALLGMGSSPGKTNVMAVRAVRDLGVAPDALHVSAAGRDLEPARDGELRAPYALQTLVDEVTLAPVVVHDGSPIEIGALSPGGDVAFPDPIGRAPTIHMLHSELRTFPESFGCRESSFRLSLPEPLLGRLRELAAHPEDVAEAAASVQPPSARTVAVHVIDATAGERRMRVSSVTSAIQEWGIGGGVVSTGSGAAAAVRLLARGSITATGAMAPERCVDPDDLMPELERRGSRFNVETEGAVAI